MSRSLGVLALACSLASACSADGVVSPRPDASCDGAPATPLSLARYQGTTVRGDALRCLALEGDGRSYIIAVQLATAALPYGGYSYRLGDPPAAPGLVASAQHAVPLGAALSLRTVAGLDLDAQSRLDQRLRAEEAGSLGSLRERRRTAGPRLSVEAASPAAVRAFRVLSRLVSPNVFDTIGARLRFSGRNVLIYVDTTAGASLTDGDVASAGSLFDDALHDALRDAFGDPSDIDRNGRVIILLTPVVNRLVTESECATSGYVRGFFHSHDLASTAPTSNSGEVFYGLVPDPEGKWSCAHRKAEVLAVTPPTFAHEFQHMISYAQRAIVRNGVTEAPWLNEGLSHLAEELGAIHYEQKYPAPAGRTNPTQIFPDSAAPFITPNLRYAHRYLFLSSHYSIVACAPGSFCTLPERAATWLFLRWLGDQKGDDVYRRLVQSAHVGGANVESAANESLHALLGDFVIALWADSIVGVPRNAVAPRHRFRSRNFRQLYQALYDAYGPVGGVGRPFPIDPAPLSLTGSVTGTMRPGTFAMYHLTIPRGTERRLLRFAHVDGELFPHSSGAQLSVLRVADP